LLYINMYSPMVIELLVFRSCPHDEEEEDDSHS